jgi:hypothetical protein
MASTSNSIAILLIAQKLTSYSIILTFIIGIISNILNILVFTSLRLFRANQCVFYLIMEAVANICLLVSVFGIQIPITMHGTDPATTSLIWCKLRTPIAQTFRLMSTSTICFAAFDQFLSTNPRLYLRQLSTLSLARRLTIVSICIWILHNIPLGFFFGIDPLLGCYIFNVGMKRYYSFFYYPILHGLLPICVSSLFSLLAYRNVRHLIRRQVTVVRRRLDRQLTAMIFIRVIFFIILVLPYTLYRIYILNTTNQTDNFTIAIQELIYAIAVALVNSSYSVRLLL